MRIRARWAGWLVPVLIVLGLPIGSASAQATRAPQLWTIAVGIDDYDHAEGSGGQTSARGAPQVLAWFARAGWEERHRVLLSDFGAEDPGLPDDPAPNIRPIRKNLDWAFREWLASRAQPGDLVVFYYAGRAGSVAKPGEPHRDAQVDYYLLPADAKPDALEASGWSLDRAVDECARKKLRVVCWLATSMGERDVQGPASPTGSNWLGRLARWPGITAWLAADRSRGREDAPDPGDRFTRALLEALGEPDREPGRNLAACLKDLHQDPALGRQGFRTLGGVPPSLALRKAQFGRSLIEADPELVLQLGHGDTINALAAPADGGLVFSASQDSTVRIWSAQDGSLVRAIPTATAEVGVTALALGRDDRWLIRGSGRGLITIHDRDRDWETPQIPRQPHGQRIVRIAALPDGFHFVSIDRGNRAFLWDLRDAPQAPKPWMPERGVKDVACGGRAAPGGEDTRIVVAWLGDGRLKMFDPAGASREDLKIPPGRLTAMSVSPDGRFIGLGYDDGQVVVRDRFTTGDSPRQAEYQAADGPIKVRRLTFSAAGTLAVEHDRGARLIATGPNGKPAGTRAFDLFDQPVQSLAFSPGGDLVAASTEGIGALRAWHLGGGSPERVIEEPKSGAAVVGFTGDNRALIVGGFGGVVALRPLDGRGKEAAWSAPAIEGKLQGLAASPDRRHLLLLDRKGTLRQARIWDLGDRTCRRLRGTWASGAFLDDDRLVLIADPGMKDLAGRLVRLDRRDLGVDRQFFRRESGDFRVPDALGFERVSVSPDGRRVAAASDASKDALVCVWRADDGRLTHWITDEALGDPVLALGFSSDGQSLLTGGESPEARLWDLSASEGELKTPAARFSDPAVDKEITCVAIRPGDSRQAVTGHTDGRVHLWSWDGGKARLEAAGLIEGEFTGAVKSIGFTTDGRYLAAAGDATSIWVGAMKPRPHAIEAIERLRPHHFEQINALATWKGLPIIISGSDDATVRFWDVEKGALQGTFAASIAPTGAGTDEVREVDWVYSTPGNLYDAPATATRLIRFRRQDRPIPVEPFEKNHRVFQLVERLLDGKEAGSLPPRSEEPAPIAISVPPRSGPSRPSTRLSVALGSDDLGELRLYHNGVPVPCPAKGKDFEVDVRLVPGPNRFYLMAEREGADDACSNTVELEYAAEPERGQVHVLAIGIGGYRKHALPHAADDARRLAEVLHARGIDAKGERGLSIVLDDDRATGPAIDEAFDQIARRVEDRPQDTVVVFLEGQTRVFEESTGFCLLRPSFPLDAGAGDGDDGRAASDHVLPYASIAANLAHLRALQRLVIVDASRAQAILEDRRVLAIQRWMETSAHRVRTSYLLAARGEESAPTAGTIGHGPLTYALLRGMRAIPGSVEPKAPDIAALRPDADFDGDGLLSTGELDAYARQVLARLAAGRPEAGTQLQSAEASFILVPLK